MGFFTGLFERKNNVHQPVVKPLLNSSTLKQILSNCKEPEVWSKALSDVLPIHNITDKKSIAMFIAQCGHESAHFNTLEENLNYSADALMKVWPKHFSTKELADRYARKPELIASRAYGNRMGNGPENTREGWKYRGRGLIQCTGKSNYMACSVFLFKDNRLIDSPELLNVTNYNAVESACWFWITNNLNQHTSDIVRTTRIINGGDKGLDDRRNLYNRAIAVLD